MTFLRLLSRSCSNVLISNRVVTCARNSNTLITGSGTSTAGFLEASVARAGIKCCCRRFHVSRRLDALPLGALLIKLTAPAVRILGLLGGRMFRRIWKRLPSHHKSQITQRIFRREDILAVIPGVILGGYGLFYVINHEETPITGRIRLMPINHSQMKEVSQLGWRQTLETFAKDILPVAHPDHQRVSRVVRKLLTANKSEKIDHMNWELFVVNNDENVNAFVFPNGQIFMFTGMLKALPNDDALAFILGHEMAHAILEHAAEQAGLHGFGNFVYVVVLATISALIPDLTTSIFANWIQGRIFAILINLPYSRMLETEADEVGINFAAKACYDVREAPKFWRTLEQRQKEEQPPEWISTHPSHGNRAKALETLVPEALELRKICNCPPLPFIPPLAIRYNRDDRQSPVMRMSLSKSAS